MHGRWSLPDAKIFFRTSGNQIEIMKFTIFILVLLKTVSSQIADTDVEENPSGWYQIEGKVYPPEIGTDENWQEDTQIIINGGKGR